jgi:hypothetical protein
MSYSKETASLVLKTVDITGDGVAIDTQFNVNNQYGKITQDGQKITWYGVDFKTLMGDMYDKYEKFNINLTSYSIKPALDPDIILLEFDCCYYISGLPFSNQTYSTRTKNNTDTALLFTSVLSTDTKADGSLGLEILPNTITIMRPLRSCDITIQALDSMNTQLLQPFNHQTFVLDIVGCDGYERNNYYNNQDILNSQPISNRLILK